MESPDYYAKAGKIATRMHELGHPSWKEGLEDSVRPEFTSAQTLKVMNGVLKEYLAAGPPIPPDFREQIEDLLDDIAQALQRLG